MLCMRAPRVYVVTKKKSSKPCLSWRRALQLFFPPPSWRTLVYAFVPATHGWRILEQFDQAPRETRL